ncbi:hypothetical protein QVD17_05612 [Tagetes erecta]|uniref:Uncharacterized protein n=1 Tax=Tagetes erecta TaxID=13708 RepID=A0AAD8LE71_TARER|nr:hypothetical protein QVD17_05612 [Tagetes erecta]
MKPGKREHAMWRDFARYLPVLSETIKACTDTIPIIPIYLQPRYSLIIDSASHGGRRKHMPEVTTNNNGVTILPTEIAAQCEVERIANNTNIYGKVVSRIQGRKYIKGQKCKHHKTIVAKVLNLKNTADHVFNLRKRSPSCMSSTMQPQHSPEPDPFSPLDQANAV